MGFDFSTLKVPSVFDQGITAKKLITTIPIRKPKSGIDFFRIRPDTENEKWAVPAYILDLGNDEEKYLLHESTMSEAIESGKLKPVTLYTGITFTGQVFFITDIPWPDAEGKDNEYNRSRRVAYDLATTKWIKIKSNKDLGAYEIIEAVSKLPDPIWPEEPATMQKAVEIAFKNNFIDSPEHPVLKRLRGEL